MGDIVDKYLWDGQRDVSRPFVLRRMLEYASFADLLKLPFAELKPYLLEVDLARLRCDGKRKRFIEAIRPYLTAAESWEEAVGRLVRAYFSKP